MGGSASPTPWVATETSLSYVADEGISPQDGGAGIFWAAPDTAFRLQFVNTPRNGSEHFLYNDDPFDLEFVPLAYASLPFHVGTAVPEPASLLGIIVAGFMIARLRAS